MYKNETPADAVVRPAAARAAVARAAAAVVAGSAFALERLEDRRLLAVDVAIDPSVTHQTWQGFGSSMISWANIASYNDPAILNAAAKDLGMSAVRFPVWQAFEAANDNADPNVFDWTRFNSAAIAPQLKFAQEMKKRGADTFLATVWTPPFWMKATSAHPYGGPLRADMRAEFAENLAAYVIAAKRDYNIDISVVSLQNEPQFIEPYESALYTPQQMILTMKAVQDKFDREGLTTKLMAPEELTLFNRWAWWDAAFRADAEVWNSDMVWGTHYAEGSHYDDLLATTRDSGNPLWLTEAAGKHDPSWNGALRMSDDIGGMMNETDVSAFFEWQFDDPNDGTSSYYKAGVPTTRYQATKHYARYIRPGAVRQEIALSDKDLDNNGQNDVFVTSWHHAGLNAQTIVFTNNYNQPTTFNVTIAGNRDRAWQVVRSTNNSYHQTAPSPAEHNVFQITLPARSMVTMYDGAGDPTANVPTATTGRGNTQTISVQDIEFNNAVRRNSLQGALPQLQQVANTTNIHDAIANGRDAIFAAAASPERGVIGVMQHLISLGADLNGGDVEGITPLMVAASTPMTWYTTQNDDPTLPSKKLTTLINAGAGLHVKDFKGRTALHWAATAPRWLYANGFPQDAQTVQTMLGRGADKNKVDRFGMTPRMWAQQEGNTAYAQTLQAWSQDLAAPQVLDRGFELDRRLAASIVFDEAMQTFAAQQVGLWQLDAGGNLGTAIAATLTRTNLAGGNTRAELVPQGRLPNGYFRAAVVAGQAIRDAAGNVLGSGDAGRLNDFWFLNADANRDKVVNVADYAIFRANFGRSNVGFGGGDFDLDGLVTTRDFLTLRQNFGLSLGDPPPGFGGGGGMGMGMGAPLTSGGGFDVNQGAGMALTGTWPRPGMISTGETGSFRTGGGAIGLVEPGGDDTDSRA